MKNKNVMKSSLSELLLPYNTRHIVCRQHRNHHNHHHNNPIALRLRTPRSRLFSTAALRSSSAHKKHTALRMGRDPVLTSVASNHPHTTKPLSHLSTQPISNIYPTHKQSPQPPIAFKDKAALMGISSRISRAVANCPDTTLSLDLRNKLGLRGIMPPAVDTPDIQIERCLARIRAKTSNLDKYTPQLSCTLTQIRVSR
jgi:hypothetical protein